MNHCLLLPLMCVFHEICFFHDRNSMCIYILKTKSFTSVSWLSEFPRAELLLHKTNYGSLELKSLFLNSGKSLFVQPFLLDYQVVCVLKRQLTGRWKAKIIRCLILPTERNILGAGEDRVWLRVECSCSIKEEVYPGRVLSCKALGSSKQIC